MNLGNIETIALAKLVKDTALKAARATMQIPVGGKAKTYNVNATVNVTGTFTVGPDEEYTPTVHIPLKEAFSLFVRYCGVTRTAAKAALVRSMLEPIRNGQTGAATVASVANEISDSDALIAEAEAEVAAMLGQLPKATRAGKVTTDLVAVAV